MHSFSFAKNIGAYIQVKPMDSFQQTSTEAASTNTSPYHDRTTSYLGESCVLYVAAQANLTDNENLILTGNLQDADTSTGSGLADFTTVDGTAAVGTTATTYGGVETFGALATTIDLTEAKQFIRTQASADFSTSSSVQDVDVFVSLIFGGFENLPTTLVSPYSTHSS